MPPTVVNVQVTPRDLNGQNVVCRIAGIRPHVRGGVIFLNPGDDYELRFNLNPAHGLTWANPPFASRQDECPNPGQNDPEFPYSGKSGANTFIVDAAPRGQTVVHYMLNFDNAGGGQSHCDPIIING